MEEIIMEEKIINVLDDEFDTEVLKSDKPVLVDFWASWCMPCKMQSEVLHEVVPKLAGKVKVVKVNVDECEKTAIKYGISSIPTLMVFVGGELKQRTVGLSSSAEISKMLIEYIG